MENRIDTVRSKNEWNDTYGDLGQAPAARLMLLPLAVLDPYGTYSGKKQPFYPYTPEMLQDLAENIRRNGVIQPISVRPAGNGRFEILAGHNRVEAAKLAGLTVVPCLVQELDDDQAELIMLDSNLKTRPYLLPSEKAFAYLKKSQALMRQGQRTDLTCGQIGHKFQEGSTCGQIGHKSRDELSDEESGRQVQRYIRLTALNKPLLDMVDNGDLPKDKRNKNLPTIAVNAGVELSYLTGEEQVLLLAVMEDAGSKSISMSQAGQLRQLSKDQIFDEDTVRGILVKQKPVNKLSTVTLPAHRISGFFPAGTSAERMEEIIVQALEAYQKGESNGKLHG